MKTTGEPTWIPVAQSRSLAATVHGPGSDEPVGVVIIVSPVGRDRAVTFRGLRFLATRAAERGFVAVRFELSGTGESGPCSWEEPAEGETPTGWAGDLVSLLDWCQATWGVQRVAGIGLLLGASLLAASQDPRWSVRLLWDQMAGRRFLRQGAMLRMISVPGDPRPDGVEHPGAWYPSALVEQIRALPAAAARTTMQPVGSPEESGEPVLSRVDSTDEEARSFHGVASLMSRVPVQRIDGIVAQLAAAAASLDRPLGAFHPVTETRTIGPTGRGLIERIVRIGEDGLATLTLPEDRQPGDVSRAVVMVAAASEPKDGPTALWVRAARSLASEGAAVLRPERPGCGELGSATAEYEANPHTQEVIRAVQESARWLSELTGDPITGVGLCSGAWAVLSAAQEPVFDAVIAINNLAWRTDLRFHERMYDEGLLDILPEPEELKVTVEEVESRGLWGRVLACAHPAALRIRAKDGLRALLQGPAPYRLWHLLGRRALADVPEILLRQVHPSTAVQAWFGPEDWERFCRYRGPEGGRRVNRARPAAVEAARQDLMDHSLLADAGREQVLQLLHRHLGSEAQRARPVA